MMNSITAGHTGMSRVAVSSVWPSTIGYPAKANAHAASDCAPRPPPSSRAISAMTTTAVIVASVAAIRTVHVWSPSTLRIARAISGVSGPWSM